MADDDFRSFQNFVTDFESGWDDDGGLHTDPEDSGGTTRWGIAQKHNPSVNVAELDREGALAIYDENYRRPTEKIVPESARKLRKGFYDAFVNGQRHAKRSLQRAIGAVPDGRWGPKSREALERAVSERGDDELFRAFMDERLVDYERIAESQAKRRGYAPGEHPHVKGWLDRVRIMRDFIES